MTTRTQSRDPVALHSTPDTLTPAHTPPFHNKNTDMPASATNGSKWVAMRHGKRLPKLNRPANQRKALLRTLVTEVLRHGRITTTKVREREREGEEKQIGEPDLFSLNPPTHASLHALSLSLPLSLSSQTKAKAIRKHVDKMIGLAKDGSLHARRQAAAFVYDKDIVAALFAEAPARYADRGSGYCRVVTEPRVRRGDSAEMAAIELV